MFTRSRKKQQLRKYRSLGGREHVCMSVVFVAEGFLSRVKDAANVVPIVSFMHSLRVSNTLSLIKHVSITDGLLLNFPMFQYSDLQISKCFTYSDFRIFKFSDIQIFRLPNIVIF